MEDMSHGKGKGKEPLLSRQLSWQKEGLYVFISILILFGIHILITLILCALLEK